MSTDDTDDKDARFEAMRAKLKAKWAADPSKARKLVATMVGSQIAAQGGTLEFADDTPLEVREAALEGYLAASIGELAAQPPIVTDVPLLARIFDAASKMRRKYRGRR